LKFNFQVVKKAKLFFRKLVSQVINSAKIQWQKLLVIMAIWQIYKIQEKFILLFMPALQGIQIFKGSPYKA